MVTIIETRNVWKTYGIDTPRRVDAVRDASIKIERSKVTAIGGPSGSGKTTLLSIIGLLIRPTQGQVVIESIEVSRVSELYRTRLRRNKIGFIFQSQYLIPQLTSIENVALPLLCTNTSRSKAEEQARKILLEMGMEDRADFRVAELSGGEQQRVSIARALVRSPEILIADEPSSSIDKTLTHELLETIRSMVSEKGLTVIVASHDPIVLDWADIVMTMSDGEIISE